MLFRSLHNELSTLRGEIQALNVRISGLDRLLERLEHSLERQEDRLHLIPPVRQNVFARKSVNGADGENH